MSLFFLIKLCLLTGKQRTRKILTEKIAQLNSAIDEVSSQLRGGDDEEDAPNGAAVTQDELGASV